MSGALASRLSRSKLACWAGGAFGFVAWLINQQMPADVLYWNCRAGGAPLGAVTGLLMGALAVTGGWISWAARPRGEAGERQENRLFLCQVNAAASGVFLLAIIAQTLASFIVPECHR